MSLTIACLAVELSNCSVQEALWEQIVDVAATMKSEKSYFVDKRVGHINAVFVLLSYLWWGF